MPEVLNAKKTTLFAIVTYPSRGPGPDRTIAESIPVGSAKNGDLWPGRAASRPSTTLSVRFFMIS